MDDINEFEKVQVTCTDNDKVFEGTILRKSPDSMKVAVMETSLIFKPYNNQGVWLSNYHGLEFTFRI